MWCKRLPSQVTVTFLKFLQRTCCTCKKVIETTTCGAMVTGQPVIEHKKFKKEQNSKLLGIGQWLVEKNGTFDIFCTAFPS